MIDGFRFDQAALSELLTGAASRTFFAGVGNKVRDRARVNARSIPTDKTDVNAIISEVGQDALGVYVDIGYSKHHPGFYLWWWEVGTRNHRAVPHLRPALSPTA